jgi:hypothetical protein
MPVPSPLPHLTRAALLIAWLAVPAAGQTALPFAPGEESVFRASGFLGGLGTATLRVDGATEDGAAAYLLTFAFRGRFGPARLEDHTRSWVEPQGFRALRYAKRERSPLTRKDVDVRFDADGGRWTSAQGTGGALTTREPLDELSFLFYLRTIPLEDGARFTVRRHYDAARNPVDVRVMGRERLRVQAGEFATVSVEIRVRDPDRYRSSDGTGVIRIWMTDDARRIPVRIESRAPVIGRVVMQLVSHVPGGAVVAQR